MWDLWWTDCHWDMFLSTCVFPLQHHFAGASYIYIYIYTQKERERERPIPVAERSKAWVCSRSPAEIAGSNPAGGMDVCLL